MTSAKKPGSQEGAKGSARPRERGLTPGNERFRVSGMHCAACEAHIERTLLRQRGVRSAKASLARGEVRVEYQGVRPTPARLNRLFAEDGYTFARHERPRATARRGQPKLLGSLLLAGALIVGFLALNGLGIAGMGVGGAGATLPALFVLGLLAGVSTCAALVGGIVLSLSKQWANETSSASPWAQARPPLLFNLGRVASYGLAGLLLGAAGSRIQLSPLLASGFSLAVSLLMLALGLQMLGVRALAGFRLPGLGLSDATGSASGRFGPALAGALTLLLPCGFTLTAEGLAVLSGAPAQGALLMLAFALGTAPSLLAIGFAGVRLSSTPTLSARFSQVAGVLVVFFALYTANAQLVALDLWNVSDITPRLSEPALAANVVLDDLLPTVQPTVYAEGGAPRAPADRETGTTGGGAVTADGKQLLRMDASARGYTPNYFVVKAGVPVRWEITDTGTSGCTNAIIARRLFDGAVPLTPGETSVVEFTPEVPGRYRFSCWMGMVSGQIDVVEG
jgi:sulfite exporter TauE/SafE/copper chaperone CopZ/plastocyanin